MPASLKLDRISKSFGTTDVLDRVDIEISAGEFVSIVGASGCGKSTLLRIIAGLETQNAGHVRIDDRLVDAMTPRERNVAVVFQNYALYPHMTAFENIATPLAMSRLSFFERLPVLGRLSRRRARIRAGIADDVRAVAAQLRIEALLDRKPGQMSGGQRQRVAVARALVRRPSLFLMDEPLSNLDAQLRVHMRDELAELHSRLGATFVYVTQEQVEAMTMSDRIVMMDKGRVAQIGSPSDLYDRPATIAVARFIGSPAMSFLSAEADASGALFHAGRRLPIDTDHAGPVLVGLRPENLAIAPVYEEATLVGRIRRVEHHGHDRLVHLDLQSPLGGMLSARVSAADALPGSAEGCFVAVEFAGPAHVFDGEGLRRTSKVARLGVGHADPANEAAE
jgi:multiple sugar transport system ATP-binding protein